MNTFVINPRLIAGLEHYARGTYDILNPSLYVYTEPSGKQVPVSVEWVCGLALKILQEEELHLLKFKTLQQGMKDYGLGDFYKKIMGETLSI